MTYREWSPGRELADRVACFWTRGFFPTDGDDRQAGEPERRLTEVPRGTGRSRHDRTVPGKQARPGGSAANGAPVPVTGGDHLARSEATVKRILPDGCMDIIWGPMGVQVAGPDTYAHLASTPPEARYIAVRFLPGGAGSVFGVPADALTDLRLSLSELSDGDAPWLEPPRTVDDLGRFRTMVADRLWASGPVPDPAVPALRRALATAAPVTQVARDLGFSQRTMRRRCLAAFGYGPKRLQRILRFQHALRRARQGDDLARVAHDCNYADQAHLANEVTDLAGVPVTRLL